MTLDRMAVDGKPVDHLCQAWRARSTVLSLGNNPKMTGRSMFIDGLSRCVMDSLEDRRLLASVTVNPGTAFQTIQGWGNFRGVRKQRTSRIVWLRPVKGAGPLVGRACDTEVRYHGKAIHVKAP
jgi:hypothetical protein